MQTADPEEIARFSKLAGTWWNPEGPFKPLHDINPLRIGFIRDMALKHFGREDMPQALHGLGVLDIGCGGGLICEPMARLGARVTGVDASAENIGTARAHAEAMGLDIDYRCATAETLLEESAKFDVVLALEIIEHVANPDAFAAACLGLARPGGLVIFSTLNRTLKAYALAIVGAEYVLRLLPRGTHKWSKFVQPHELAGWIRAGGGELLEMQGMVLHPLSFTWSLSNKDMSVNYFMAARS